ncbi:myogenesis-regulating glycosidase, partial [Aphis craccivora]
INPLLKRYVQEALETAVPLIRPLWMLDPSDTTCYIVKDEFSIGEEVIVAPILRPGATEREVYLPAGVWQDGIEGSLRKGSRWIHNYKIPLDKIAWGFAGYLVLSSSVISVLLKSKELIIIGPSIIIYRYHAKDDP